jgi:xanthine/uracil/vitamin C permease (AzgA family)
MPVGGKKREKMPMSEVIANLNPMVWQGDTPWSWNMKVPMWTGSGEMEAFCELFFDNLATLLGVTGSASYVGSLAYTGGDMPVFSGAIMEEWMRIYFEWHIPACGLGLLFGNIWFAWLATRLASKENRLDVCAQPYGMNTTVIYITLFAISLPGLGAGVAKFKPDATASPDAQIEAGKKVAEYGWKVSVAANFIIGMMEILGCFLGDLIRNTIPTAAVYTPLAGVGFVWLAFSPMLNIVKHPMMCLLPFMVVVVGFFGNVRYPIYGKVTFPIALTAILMSVLFGWLGACERSTKPLPDSYLYFLGGGPTPSVADFYNGGAKTCQGTDGKVAKKAWDTYAFKGEIFGGFGKGLSGLGEADLMSDFAAPSLLFGMIGFLGTMTCVESAEAAGDAYPMSEIMIVDGIGTTLAAVAGSMFGTTVYIGHPVHKALGAKIGYSILNGIVYFIFLSTGLFACLYNVIPECASGAILVFVGLLLARQAFEESPSRHYPCLLLGLMPFICNWAWLQADGNASRNMGVLMMAPGGGIVVGIIFAAISAWAIDRKFEEVTVFSLLSAFMSLFGIAFSHNDVINFFGVWGAEHQTLDIYAAGSGVNKDSGAAEEAYNGWRWTVAFIMVAFFFACHIPFQVGNKYTKFGLFPPRIENDEEDPYDFSAHAGEKATEVLPK